MKIRKSKLAAITVSLSWVFMIIVGTFFIMLAYNIVAKYKANEEVKLQISIENTVRNVFNEYARTSGVEENSLAPLENIFKNRRVEILCTDGIPLLSIDENIDTNNNYIRTYPTFMTYIKQGKADKSFMAVESFRMPFKVTNLLGVVSLKNLIVIDSNSDFGEKLFYKFRKSSYSQLNYEYIGFDDLSAFEDSYVKGRNLNSIVFVTDADTDVSGLSLADLGPVAYLVKIDEVGSKYGNITYVDKEGDEYSFGYYDYDESLSLQTMAVFSNPQTFNCSYNLLFSAFDKVYDFYINKTEYYYSYDEVVCNPSMEKSLQDYYFDELEDILVDIQDKVKTKKFNNLEDLNSNMIELDSWYLHLEEYTCPYIY